MDQSEQGSLHPSDTEHIDISASKSNNLQITREKDASKHARAASGGSLNLDLAISCAAITEHVAKKNFGIPWIVSHAKNNWIA